MGLLVGAVLAALLLVLPAPPGMPLAAWRAAALLALVATWWVTEAIPLGATALLPLVLVPILGLGSLDEAATPFADPLVFLFLGGFLLALGAEASGLPARLARRVLAWTGPRPRAVLAGLLVVTALVSMWVNNTATVLLMMPLALSALTLLRPGGRAPGAWVLAVVYGASIGGLGTLVGTPPNALVAAYLEREHGVHVGFVDWMMLGVPLMIVLLPVAWLILARGLERAAAPGAAEVLRAQAAAQGRWSPREVRMALVFGATAALWIARPFLPALPGLSDAGVAIAASVLLFLVPAGKGQGALLAPDALTRVPWDVLVLFGGGLSLAETLDRTGLSAWLAQQVGAFGGLPAWAVLALVLGLVVALSEVMSNTAAAATLLPLGTSVGVALGAPAALFAFGIAVAASGGFMLPVATPSNAIALGTGRVRTPEMLRAGLLLDLALLAATLAVAYFLAPWALGFRV